MTSTKEQLEGAFARVRALPEERQQAALEALNEIAAEPYTLTDEDWQSSGPPSIARDGAKS
jgi:hypothetical protein